MRDPTEVAARFTENINRRDPGGLAALMTDDHRSVDSAGSAVDGERACLDGWRGFFAAVPDYRNVVESPRADGDVVTITGYPQCSEPGLDGPARWTATIRDGRVAGWRVTDE